ncbi:MAG: CRISPR system precrRNA processing endoribonuclease RAMP protein Cas6 [Candidatus Rokuibacteriota bacterium]
MRGAHFARQWRLLGLVSRPGTLTVVDGMEWAGSVGIATYEGDLAPFWLSLMFGQWTHVGKGATFGPGRDRLEPAEGEARG